MSINVGDFVAGWFAGVTSLLISYPFDTIKARQQAYHISFFHAVKDAYHYQGIYGFYNGILSPLITYGPSNSIFFGIYGNTMRYLKPDVKVKDEKSIMEEKVPTDFVSFNRIMIAGTIAGILQTVVYCPIEYVKTLLQVNTDYEGALKKYYITPYKNTFQAIAGIYRTTGLLGFYRGLMPMLFRDGPSGGIYMLTYEMIRQCTSEPVGSLGTLGHELLAGGTAGMVSIAPMIPFDVVKTHMQIDNPRTPYFKGVIDCFIKLYSQSGGRIFFQGLPITCYKAFPAHAVMFVAYEYVISFFHDH